MPLRTADMQPPFLAVADTIRDNDPRMPGRTLRIVDFEADENDSRKVRAVCTSGRGRDVRILVSRIFMDDKPRRSGWTLVSPSA